MHSFVRADETEIIPPGVAGHSIASVQKERVFGSMKRVARLRSARFASGPFDWSPGTDETIGIRARPIDLRSCTTRGRTNHRFAGNDYP